MSKLLKIRVENGIYEFIVVGSATVTIRRAYDNVYRLNIDDTHNGMGSAIISMMMELDAARAVVDAARDIVHSPTLRRREFLEEALAEHDGLTCDREPPTEWARAARKAKGDSEVAVGDIRNSSKAAANGDLRDDDAANATIGNDKRAADRAVEMNMGRLASAIRAVQDARHDSPEAEQPLLDIHGQDLGVIEWICRLVPGAVLRRLEGTPSAALYGDRSIDPGLLLRSMAIPGMSDVKEGTVKKVIHDPASWQIVAGEAQDPVPMRLCCEGCGKLHVDEGEFATRPHHTHSCQYCGLTWRPAVCHTIGVRYLPGFRNEPADPTTPPFGGAADLGSHTVVQDSPTPAVSSGGSPAATNERKVTDSQLKVSLVDGFLPKSLTDIIRRLPQDRVVAIAESAMWIFQQERNPDARYGTIVREGDPSWIAAIVQACRTHGIPCGDDGEVTP